MAEITPAEIEAIRQEQLGLMPDTMQVYRKVTVDGDSAWVPYGPSTKARITPYVGSLWRTAADKLSGLTAYTITFPVGTDVKAGDQIYDVYGRQYLVRDAKRPSTYHTALQLLCEAVDDA